MDKNELVVKSNSLIRSRYDYSLAELRLVISVASMVDEQDEDFRTYILPAAEYAELLGADRDSSYYQLKQLGEKLLSKPLYLPNDDGFTICNWFSSYQYLRGQGSIKVRFSPNLKPHLLALQERFTSYQLEHILRFKSPVSIRLYEIAKSWEANGEFVYGVDELKQMLGAEGKYARYADFKRYIVQRAVREINKTSDIELRFAVKKLGRRVSDLVFKVKSKALSADYMATRKAFIEYIRVKYRPNPDEDSYPTIVTTTSGNLKIDAAGRLYLVPTAGTLFEGETDYTAEQADKLWSWLYQMVKDEELSLK